MGSLQNLAYQAKAGQAPPRYIKGEQGILPRGMGFKKPVHTPKISPDPTARGLPQQIKLYNCHTHSEGLVLSHSGFPAVRTESMSLH